MEQRDLHRFGTLRQLATKHKVTVLSLEQDTVVANNWETSETFRRPLNLFLEEHELLHRPTGLPRYALTEVMPLPDFVRAVQILVVESELAFCDDCPPLTLHIRTEGISLLEDYLEALTAGDAWLCREADGSAYRDEQALRGDTGQTVTLDAASNENRYPSHWLSISTGADTPSEVDSKESLLEICVRDEALAKGLFQAITVGTLVLQS